MTSPNRPPRRDERAHRAGGDQLVERVARQGGEVEAGRVEGAGPDRHAAAVEDDRQRVQTDADRGHLEPGHLPVPPQPGEEEEVDADERDVGEPGHAGRRVVEVDGHDAQRERQPEQPDPAKPQVPDTGNAAPRQRAGDDRQRDGAKEHRRRRARVVARRARRAGLPGGAWWAARRRPSRGRSSVSRSRPTRIGTISGSNWMPENFSSCSTACSWVSGVLRYGRELGHRLVCIRDGHDPGAERDVERLEPVRVAGAVDPLVVGADERRLLRSWLAGATISAPMRRVLVHEHPLLAVERPLLEQDVVADPDLADVVEQARPLDPLDLVLRQMHDAAHRLGRCGSPGCSDRGCTDPARRPRSRAPRSSARRAPASPRSGCRRAAS